MKAPLLVLQFGSVAQSCLTLCNPMNHSTPGFPVHHQLPEFTQTHVHQVSDAIQPSHPLSSPSPLALNISQHQDLFKWVTLQNCGSLIRILSLEIQRWEKCRTRAPISDILLSSKKHPGLISFRMDWLDLLAVQGTLKSRLQHHSLKASILRHSAFFTVQLSHPYSTHQILRKAFLSQFSLEH